MTVSGGVFALLQGAVADLTQELGVVAQRSDMASVDVLWVDPEVIGAEVGQPLRHRIDLGLPGHEGVERLAKAALSLRSDPLSYLHRLAPTAPAVPVPMLDSGTSSSHSSRRAPSGSTTARSWKIRPSHERPGTLRSNSDRIARRPIWDILFQVAGAGRKGAWAQSPCTRPTSPSRSSG